MSDKDLTANYLPIPQPGAISKKPPFLVTLEPSGKGKTPLLFVSVEKPVLLAGFIETKGFYVELSEDEVLNTFGEVLASTPKNTYIELMLPAHRIVSIRNLVFNAHKPPSLIRKGFE